jgi:hypothetical protein
MLRLTGVVRARVAGKRLLVAGDEKETCAIERKRAGSHNTVLFLREYDDVVVRVSREPLDADEQSEYYAEIEAQRELARAGIAPRVFCVMHFTTAARFSRAERPYARRVRLGYAMERFDVSLGEALDGGYEPTRKGRRALVELFERAATMVRCVDTTAANVVARFTPSGAEFRLIDVDGYFCGHLSAEAESVGNALASWDAGRARASAGAYAALGLLVLCVQARIAWLARYLLRHEVGLVRLVADDAAAEAMDSARDRLVWTHARVSAVSMLRRYGGVRAPWDVPAKLREIASQ